jgi:hypothetical protein
MPSRSAAKSEIFESNLCGLNIRVLYAVEYVNVITSRKTGRLFHCVFITVDLNVTLRITRGMLLIALKELLCGKCASGLTVL